ncbi:hypothetical protein ABI59_09015 [Acidobacteria bacterium Mor1]|nr:hypothetical protein ABI59_09015 [Acidobacteria bacterium Mor1]
MVAGIEAGGTKFICAVADGEGAVLELARIATRTPEETFRDVRDFFAGASAAHGPVAGAGVASFGPLDLRPGSPNYGHLTTTPKPGWQGFDIGGAVRETLGAPVRIDTDVNCAARAEGMAGAARGLSHFAYMTVGTGIGVGVFSAGDSVRGAGHTEIGHMRVPRAAGDERFPGVCPYHGDCVEGLASGPAMAERWGSPAEELPDDHDGWRIEAFYIGTLCANLTFALRPERIILGGGVFQRASLYERVRTAYRAAAAGYALSEIEQDTESFLASPGLTQEPPGLVGALLLGKRAAESIRGG